MKVGILPSMLADLQRQRAEAWQKLANKVEPAFSSPPVGDLDEGMKVRIRERARLKLAEKQ